MFQCESSKAENPGIYLAPSFLSWGAGVGGLGRKLTAERALQRSLCTPLWSVSAWSIYSVSIDKMCKMTPTRVARELAILPLSLYTKLLRNIARMSPEFSLVT